MYDRDSRSFASDGMTPASWPSRRGGKARRSTTRTNYARGDATLRAMRHGSQGNHRRPDRVPPVALLVAAAAEGADVDLVHYDRDYERIAAVGAIRQEWLVPDGTLA
jgi:hypothetical protein